MHVQWHVHRDLFHFLKSEVFRPLCDTKIVIVLIPCALIILETYLELF